MPLGEIAARPDWRAIEIQERETRERRRTEIQLVLVAYGAATVGLHALYPRAVWLILAFSLMFAAVLLLLLLPLQIPLGGRRAPRRILGGVVAILAGAIVLAMLTTPTVLRGPGWPGIPALSPWLAIAIPIAMGVLLAWSERSHRGLLRSLGLAGQRWGWQAAIGLAAGVALGFHFWLVLGALPAHPRPSFIGLPEFAWLVACLTGLISLSQELMLRGMLPRMLTHDMPRIRRETWLRLTLLNLMLYLAPVLVAPRQDMALIILAYGAGFAQLAMALRHELRSAIAPLAANVAFSIFLALVILP